MDTALFKKLVRFYRIHSSGLKPGKFSARGDRLRPVESHVNQEVKCVLVTAAGAITAQESPITIRETCITDSRLKAALLFNSAEQPFVFSDYNMLSIQMDHSLPIILLRPGTSATREDPAAPGAVPPSATVSCCSTSPPIRNRQVHRTVTNER